MLPDISSLLEGIITGFLNLFLDPGGEAIKAALTLLLGNADGPNLKAAWILEIYGFMFALGFVFALFITGWEAMTASISGNTYKLLRSWQIALKSYLGGFIVPGVFYLGFAVSSAATHAIAVKLVPQPESLIDSLARVNPGTVIGNIIVFVPVLLCSVLLGIVSLLATSGLAIVSFLLAPLFLSISKGEKSSKAYGFIVAIGFTAMFATPAIFLEVIGLRVILSKLVADSPAWLAVEPFMNLVILVVALLIPYIVYRLTHKKAEEFVARGALSARGQMKSAESARQKAAPAAYKSDTHRIRHAARDIAGFAVAGGVGYLATRAMAREKEPGVEERSVKASKYAHFASTSAAAVTRRIVETGKVTSGTALISVASIGASRLSKRHDAKHATKTAPQGAPTTKRPAGGPSRPPPPQRGRSNLPPPRAAQRRQNPPSPPKPPERRGRWNRNRKP